jgi:hypothetical protein
MKYLYLENLTKTAIAGNFDDPSKHTFARPPFPVERKSDYRAWCAKPDTDHCFFTMAEGDNRNQRIGVENPINKLYGWVADYDAELDWARVDQLIADRCDGGPLPMWRSKTQSNYIRLVWEFEEPILVAPALADAFYKRLSDAFRASMLLAGFDKTSLKSSQYFEIGQEWTRMGNPVSSVFVRTLLLKAANDVVIRTEDTNIPIDAIAEEVISRFPNRWKGEFAIGARGPLFWIDDNIDRDGCQVREDGMVCYSDRAGAGFRSWREILGKKFMDQFEQKKLGTLLDQYWFNGKAFYKMHGHTTVTIPKDQLILELRKSGFTPKLKKGQQISEIEQAILTISNECRVDEVAPVVFSKERVVSFNGRRILNNCYTTPVKPALDGDPKHWPWIHQFVIPFFADDDRGVSTLPYFLAWFQRLYKAVLNHRLDQGHLLILLGPTGHGKTLLTNQIVGSAVGGFSDASDYLSGKTSFNKDLCGSAAWVIDDQVAAATYADQRKFVELTKRCVANPRLEYHAKYADAVPLPWCGRVMMSLNLDANSLAALPTLDSSNRDKIIALRINSGHKTKFGSNEWVESTISSELPFFLRWLHDWQAPPEVQDSSRFGVKTYIDPFIEAAAYDNSSRSAIAEMVEFFAKKVRDVNLSPSWRGTLTEFTVVLHEVNGGRSVGNSNNLEFVRRGMTVLEEVSRHNHNVRKVRSRGNGGGKIWEIDLSESFDIDQGESF